MFSKLRYSSQWVSVSEEGFHLPSTFLPVRMSTSTMSSGESWSYSTPLGLMAIMPLSRSMPMSRTVDSPVFLRYVAPSTSMVSP